MDFAQSIFAQFNNLWQEDKSVTNYTKEFYILMACNDVQETEDQLIARYVNGLRIFIQDEVMHWNFILNNVYQLALKVEARIGQRG